jgi:MYXO-CTERM domain-containing protein
MITMTGCCGCGCGTDAAPRKRPRIPAPIAAPAALLSAAAGSIAVVVRSRTIAKTIIFLGAAIIFLSLRDRSFK